MKEFILGGIAALLFFIQCIWSDFFVYLIIGGILVICLAIGIEFIQLKIKQLVTIWKYRQKNITQHAVMKK